MVELRTRKREMGADCGSHHEKLGLKRILGAIQFTIPGTAGTSPDPECNNTDTRTSQPNQASCTADLSCPLVSSTSFSCTSPSLSFSSTTLPSSKNTKFSHRSLSLHDMIMGSHWVQHTPSTAHAEYRIHRVQHTLSTAYTEYSIHQVQHTPSTAYTEYSIRWVQHTLSIAYTEYSLHWVKHLPKIVSLPFLLTITSWPRYVASGCGMPPTRSTAISQLAVKAPR